MRRMATLGAIITDEEACFTIMNNEHVDLGIVAAKQKKNFHQKACYPSVATPIPSFWLSGVHGASKLC